MPLGAFWRGHLDQPDDALGPRSRGRRLAPLRHQVPLPPEGFGSECRDPRVRLSDSRHVQPGPEGAKFPGSRAPGTARSPCSRPTEPTEPPSGSRPILAPATNAETAATWPFRSSTPVSPSACPRRARPRPRFDPWIPPGPGSPLCWATRRSPPPNYEGDPLRPSGCPMPMLRKPGWNTSGRERSATRRLRRRPQPSRSRKPDGGVEIPWDAAADFESGLRQFVIQRDGQEIGRVPEKPVRPVRPSPVPDHVVPRHPEAPVPAMRFVDKSDGAGGESNYQVIAVNGVEAESAPSPSAQLP